MADYPDWVLKHKKKGTYVNVIKGKYYLYAAHSERVPGTKKVKRICDGYLGRITEEEGLIPTKDKVSGSVSVLEYGLSSTILTVCSKIHAGFRRSFTKNGDFVMVASILSFIYGVYTDEVFHLSYLCIRYPELDFKVPVSSEQAVGIERGVRMIADTLSRHFGDDLPDIRIFFRHIQKANVNGKQYLSEESDSARRLKEKYNLSWEG